MSNLGIPLYTYPQMIVHFIIYTWILIDLLNVHKVFDYLPYAQALLSVKIVITIRKIQQNGKCFIFVLFAWQFIYILWGPFCTPSPQLGGDDFVPLPISEQGMIF